MFMVNARPSTSRRAALWAQHQASAVIGHSALPRIVMGRVSALHLQPGPHPDSGSFSAAAQNIFTGQPCWFSKAESWQRFWVASTVHLKVAFEIMN